MQSGNLERIKRACCIILMIDKQVMLLCHEKETFCSILQNKLPIDALQ